MSFLEHLVDRDQSFEGLYFIGEDGLAVLQEFNSQLPSSNVISYCLVSTYTFMPSQKASDRLWSHV